MATIAELTSLQKAILRRTDAAAAETHAAAGTTVAQFTEMLLKQAETSTLPALIVYEYVYGKTQSQALLDKPLGGAEFAAKQYEYYRDQLKVANPQIGAYEAFGSALAGSAEFHALSDGRSTQQFITDQYDAIFGPAVAVATISAGTRLAGIAALSIQVDYFTRLYSGTKLPSGELMSAADALNQARAAVLGQMLGIASTESSLGLNLVTDGKAFLKAAVAGTAVFEAPFETTPGVGSGTGGKTGATLTLSIQQVLDGVAKGNAYILADRLEKIVANPDIMKAAESYKLTNSIGGVGAVTVEGAKVLLGASNATNFDYSLADSGPAVKAASATVIAEADTIAVIGAPNGETLDFSRFGKSVILNGKDGADVLRGTAFNDVYYGGGGTNSYYTNGGSDTLHLSDGAIDLIYLTASASGGFKSGAMHVFGFDPANDKLVISNADFSTNLEGSWTRDDYRILNNGYLATASGNVNLANYEPHAVGVFYYGSYPRYDEVGLNRNELINFMDHSEGDLKIERFDLNINWRGLFWAHDQVTKTEYIFYAETGSDDVIEPNEITLVAILHDTLAHPMSVFTL